MVIYYISNMPSQVDSFRLEVWTMHRSTYLVLKLNLYFFSLDDRGQRESKPRLLGHKGSDIFFLIGKSIDILYKY